MLGGEVEEREQDIGVLLQRRDGLRVLRAVLGGELRNRLARLPAGLGVYDVVERGLHVGLEALRELVEYVAELWNQSRCSRVFGHAELSAWDAEALEHAAHRLKGMLMALAAPAASRAALRLEDIARERDLRLAADARAALARVLARLEPQLDALAPGEPGGGRHAREPAPRTGG